MLRAENLPEIPDRVDYWLNQWARWTRKEPSRLGYPPRTLGLVGGGESRRTDEWEEDTGIAIWQRNCEVMEALIESLPPAQGCAIRHVYSGDEWPKVFRFHNLLKLIELAASKLLIGMNARVVI